MGENLDALKDIAKKTIRFIPKIPRIAMAVGEHFLSPLMIPTYVRRNDWVVDGGGMEEFVQIYWILSIPIAGLGSVISGLAKDQRLLYYPAALITGNAVSALYEWFLYEKEKYKPFLPGPASPLPPSASSSGPPSLEQKVVEEEKDDKKNARIPREIPNPWDIDIPKIEDQKVGRYHDERRM